MFYGAMNSTNGTDLVAEKCKDLDHWLSEVSYQEYLYYHDCQVWINPSSFNLHFYAHWLIASMQYVNGCVSPILLSL